jgi:hypothetical protein
VGTGAEVGNAVGVDNPWFRRYTRNSSSSPSGFDSVIVVVDDADGDDEANKSRLSANMVNPHG